jgi:hypothetical protein
MDLTIGINYLLLKSHSFFLNLAGIASIVTNVHDWYGNTSLIYTVKDVDDYPEAGYRVNTVPATLNHYPCKSTSC